MKVILSLALLIFTLGACSTYSDEEIKGFDKKIKAYLQKEGIECEKSPSGLYYKIVDKGEGRDIKYKDNVSFTYKGSFLNGKVFADQVEPVEFEVSKLIGCWQEVILNLKPGPLDSDLYLPG